MLIYKKIETGLNKGEKNPIPDREYIRDSLDDVRLSWVMSDTPDSNSVHSWYVDENEKEIIELAREGNLEEIKRKIAGKEDGPQYLAGIRFCSDGFSTHKYAETEGGAFDGYGLLNVALFCGHKEMIKYLINECGMNPNDKRYGNAIWTAALPTDLSHTEPHSEMLPLLSGRFQVLKELLEEGEIIMPIEIAGSQSAKVNDSVFHIAGRVKDHDLRGDMLSFFAQKVPADAAKRSDFGLPKNSSAEERDEKRKTPISMLCTNLKWQFDNAKNGREIADIREYFKRDLETLKSCGCFETYGLTSECRTKLEQLPPQLCEVLNDAFNPSQTLESTSGQTLSDRANSRTGKPKGGISNPL